ncbi:MAG: flippase [Deltaproteobacteria bacterium]|nr:flippase [Deltaproteobacteria bacterium]
MNNHHLARGSIYLIASLVAFHLSGYLIHFMLVRIINPITYGTIGVILSILTVLQIFLLHGIPTAAAKYLSEGANGKEIRDKSLLLQLIYALFIAFLVFITAPMIADLLNDQSYTTYIRFLPIVIFVRSINQLFNNFFNGYREFMKQSIHMAIDSFPRLFFVFTFIYMGYGVYGVLGGYAAASLIGIIYAIYFFEPKKTNESVSYRQILSFSFPVILYSVLFHLITSLDLFFIKSSTIPGESVGFYTSARVLSTIFTIVSISFSLTLLPSISHSISTGDTGTTRSYIQTSLRYLFIVFFPIALIISVYSKELLSLFFTPEYAKAGNALSILIWGWLFLQIFFVLSAMINASGRSKIPAKIAGTALFVSVVGNYFLIGWYGIEGGALATLSAGVVCCMGGLYYVWKIFGVTVEFKSTIKVFCGALMLLMGCIVFNWDGAFLFGWSLLLAASYLAFLLFVKAITKTDIVLVRELLTAAISEGAKTQP